MIPGLYIFWKTDDIVTAYWYMEEVASLNHDEHGWAGIDAVLSALKAVAAVEGVEVSEDDGS